MENITQGVLPRDTLPPIMDYSLQMAWNDRLDTFLAPLNDLIKSVRFSQGLTRPHRILTAPSLIARATWLWMKSEDDIDVFRHEISKFFQKRYNRHTGRTIAHENFEISQMFYFMVEPIREAITEYAIIHLN
jgi:hypothetical protein